MTQKKNIPNIYMSLSAPKGMVYIVSHDVYKKILKGDKALYEGMKRLRDELEEVK